MNRNLRSGQAGRVAYQLGEVIKSGIRSGMAKNKSGQLAQADAVLAALQCIPLQDIPSTFEAEIVIRLPMSEAQFQNLFGQALFNPLNILQANASLGVVEAFSDFGNANQLAADFCLQGIGVTIEGENENLVIPGVLADTAATSVTSACDYADADLDTSLPAFSGLVPAVANWGYYSRQGAENLADALSASFTIAERLVVIDEPLATLASCGTRQGGMGFSRSETDTPFYVQAINSANAALGADGIFTGKKFVAVNSRRTGQTGGLSLYTPDACAGRIADMSANVGLRHSIYTNDCTRIFDKPILMKAGRPFNFNLFTRSKLYMAKANASLTDTFGGVQDETGFSAPGPAFNECDSCADAAGTSAFTAPGNTAVVKGGYLKIKVCFLGVLLYEQALCDAFNAVCSQYGDACMLQP